MLERLGALTLGPPARALPGARAGGVWINLALYQVGWFACVLGAAAGHAWSGAGLALALTAVHVALVRDRGNEVKLLLAAAALGLLVDSVQLNLGVFGYPAGTPVAWLAPPWILVLWLQFATLLHFALRWLSGRYLLAGALGLVGGPLSFGAGARLGAIEFPSLAAFLALGAVWALVVPALIRLADRFELRQEGYR